MARFTKQDDAPVAKPVEQFAERRIVEARQRFGRRRDTQRSLDDDREC
ncbi:hypothetical protein [Mesorhizobium sp.]|nr:hypothetical protein [Mesorhizobium sp.]